MPSSAERTSSRRWIEVLGRIVVVLLGTVVLLHVGSRAWDYHRAGVEAPTSSLLHARWECLRDEMAGRLPEEAVVHVPLQAAATDTGLWHQRLVELAFPMATISATPGAGVLTLTVEDDPTGGGCLGIRLVMEEG